MGAEKIKKGDILLAEPFMSDGNFKKAAILITDLHNTGSVGFILNKPMNVNVSDLLASFPEFESNVYFGGPVATDTIHYLHTVGDLLEGSHYILNGVYWGGDYQKLKFLIKSGLINPSQIRFYIGYSGWSSGQLEAELEDGSWVIAYGDPNYVFKSAHHSLWKQVMMDKSDIMGILADIPDNYNPN
jgi:putative transcriptional regulator